MLKLTDHIGNDWLGAPIHLFEDPWYRFSRVIEIVERLVTIEPGRSWLDAGCHQGQFLGILSARNGVRPVGIDAWDESSAGSALQYHQRDLQKGFQLEEQFDYISALEVLEHMVDTDAFLEECRSHLKPHGLLVLSTPNINSLRNRITTPLGIYPAAMEYKTVIHHVRLYNKGALNSHLREHGFEVLRIAGVNLLPQKWLSNAAIEPLSAVLSDALPQLCGNLIAVARKI